MIAAIRNLGCLILLAYSSLTLSACNPLDAVLPLIGLDHNGEPSQIFMSQGDYIRRVSSTAGSVQKTTIQALSKSSSSSDWMLRVVVFGVGVNAQIGLGPFKIGAYPKMRFVFSNTKNSYVP